MNFGELIARVRRYRGTDSGTEDSASLTYIKESINSVYREILSANDYPWLVKEVTLQTTAPFNDGVLTATNGLNIMTLHDTSTYTGFDYRFWGGKLKAAGEEMYYEVIKTSMYGDSTCYVYLDRPYQGSSTTSLSYTLYRDSYPLPSDFRKVHSAPRYAGDSTYALKPRTPAAYDGLHTQVLHDTPTSDPSEYTVWKRQGSAWFTSTATVTNGVSSITLEGDSSYFGVQNWRFRVIEDASGERYRVVRQGNAALADDVVLELDRPYGGATGSNTVVTVDPRGMPLIQIWEPPQESSPIIVKYYSDDYDLVNDTDEPVIPEAYHDSLWKGACYLIAQFDDDGDGPEIDRLYRDYMQATMRLQRHTTDDKAVTIQRGMYRPTRGIHSRYRWPEEIEP